MHSLSQETSTLGLRQHAELDRVWERLGANIVAGGEACRLWLRLVAPCRPGFDKRPRGVLIGTVTAVKNMNVPSTSSECLFHSMISPVLTGGGAVAVVLGVGCGDHR